MLKNSLKIAMRIILRNKGYSLINILGLAIGMACCILIVLYVQDELSYDNHNQKAERIYRLSLNIDFPGRVTNTAKGIPLLGPALVETFPEVINSVRFRPPQLTWLVSYEDKKFNESGFVFADASVFDIFTLPFLKGNPATALSQPNTVVISESMSKKYFGDEDPMGKTITADNDFAKFMVTGVMQDMPRNSHARFDFLPSFSSLENLYGERYVTSSQSFNFFTYILLSEDASVSALEERFPDLLGKQFGPLFDSVVEAQERVQLHLQPLTDIHLYSNLDDELAPNGDIATIYIFSGIAVVVLLIACINFMNLATAHSANRAKEVGMRKVAGAYRGQLIQQFLTESILLAGLAMLLAILLVQSTLPVFNTLTGKSLSLLSPGNGLIWIALITTALFVGIFSGAYPALFLSAFRPIAVLKGNLKAGSKSSGLRMGLVVIQFVVSISFITGTIIVSDQLDFIRNKRLGFDKNQVVVVPLPNREAALNYPTMRQTFLRNANVISASTSSNVPGGRGTLQVDRTLGFRPEGATDDIDWQLHYLVVDYDFIDTLGIELAQGRNFSEEFGTDLSQGIIINEAAVKAMKWESPIGKRLEREDRRGGKLNVGVIGVVKDFHFKSLHQPIEPMVLLPAEAGQFGTASMSVKIRPEDMMNTLAFLENTWQAQIPEWAFDYSFLDQEFDRHYASEEQLEKLVGYFTVLAIFIACLGLLGLASFITAQRTKEIGVRKVLGASAPHIVMLLSKEFVMWILIATVIAWPITYIAMDRWLQNFAYRTEIDLGNFFLAGGIALSIALLTVSYHALRAAFANPVDTLKYE